MKNWHQTLLGIFVGVILSAGLFLIASPPRGTAVELLPAPTLAPMLVHVDGAVRTPGVYPLEHGSRVQDAIQAAGGFGEQANSSALNLAASLRDGDKLHVPAVGTPVAPVFTSPERGDGLPQNERTELVDLNSASLEELGTLPGIGPTRAQDIIAYREQHGGFQTTEDLLEVSGIGPTTFERLKGQITVVPTVP